jgi:thiamine-phosphate pyrophosphorylase
MGNNVATAASAAGDVAAIVRLMLVTDDRWLEGRDLVEIARAAERGGVTSVQLRLKRAAPREQAALARALVAALRVPVLVNDRLDVALAAGAAGVHLGPDDLPPELARRVAPPGFLIGVSVGAEAETGAASAAAADYWGIGPWRGTATKADAGAPLGAGGFATIAGRAAGRPCIAIGGIEPADVREVLAAGGSGVAVVSGILGTEPVEAAARNYAHACTTAFGSPGALPAATPPPRGP